MLSISMDKSKVFLFGKELTEMTIFLFFSTGVYKKLEAAGKKKGCQKVKDWARSISNHMYWCAASSGGDGEFVQQKWLSILNHVANIHSGHGEKFPHCEHGQLDDRDWMKKGT